MKNHLVILSSLFLILMSSASFAGVDSSGGGKGVVCRTPDSKIRSVQLLDLWEADIIYGRPPSASALPVENQVRAAMKRLKYSFHTLQVKNGPGDQYDVLERSLNAQADLFLKPNAFVKYFKNIKLTVTADSYEVIQPNLPGCEIEQIIVYQDTPNGPLIYVNADIYEAMEATQKAALIVHEALYSYLRNYLGGEKNSIRVRRVVGLAFSGFNFVPVERLSPVGKATCDTNIGNDGFSMDANIDLFKVPTSTGFYFVLRVNIADGTPIFGLLQVPVEEKDLDLLERLKKPRDPRQTNPLPAQKLLPTWSTSEYQQVENETSLKFDVYKFEDGSAALGFTLLSHSQNPQKGGTVYLSCH